MENRNKSDKEANGDRSGSRVGHDALVDCNRLLGGQELRGKMVQCIDGHIGKGQTDSGSSEREYQAFPKEKPSDGPTASSEGGANCKLTALRVCASQSQIGYIGASDEENEDNSTLEQVQSGL